jgi:hypothetical protein
LTLRPNLQTIDVLSLVLSARQRLDPKLLLCGQYKQKKVNPHSDANTVEVPRFCGLSTSKYFHNHLDRTTKKYLCHVLLRLEFFRWG